jgi:ABC-type transporter Mla subunit MlaD
MLKIPTRRIKSTFLIGLFTIVGTLVIISAIIWLGAIKLFQEKNYYVTYFEGSIEGLETGSPVKYLGVPVGTVSKISVAPDGRLIQVVLQLHNKINNNDSLRVKAEIAGIAGAKFLQLFYQQDSIIASLYPKLSFEPPYELIKSSPSGLEEIGIVMKNVVDKIMGSTVAFLTTSTEFFNNPDLYGIITNLNKSSRELSSILLQADTSGFIDNITKSGSEINKVIKDLALFTQKLNSEIDSLRISYRLTGAFYKLDTAVTNAAYSVTNIGAKSEILLIQLVEALEQFKESNRQLQKSLRLFSENPSQVLFSEPPPVK